MTDNNLHIIYQKSLKIYIKKFDKLDIIVLDLWKLLNKLKFLIMSTKISNTVNKLTTSNFGFQSFSDVVKGHKLAAISASSLVKTLQSSMNEDTQLYLHSLAIVGKFEAKPLPCMHNIIDAFKTLEPSQFVKLIAINSDGKKIDGLSLLTAVKAAAKKPLDKWVELA